MVFFAISILFSRVCELSVQTINFELFLRNLNMTLFDQSFLVSNLSFLIFKFANKFIKLLLKKFVLALSVEVINLNTGNFVANILNLDLLLTDIFVGLLGLFE